MVVFCLLQPAENDGAVCSSGHAERAFAFYIRCLFFIFFIFLFPVVDFRSVVTALVCVAVLKRMARGACYSSWANC
ncbi:hypothetical protein BDV10DRAFT_29954 [Aspergillus recurvatus]